MLLHYSIEKLSPILGQNVFIFLYSLQMCFKAIYLKEYIYIFPSLSALSCLLQTIEEDFFPIALWLLLVVLIVLSLTNEA